MAKYAIYIMRPGQLPAWHTGHRETLSARDAKIYDTREQAEEHLALCGLYRLMGWKTEVKRVS